MTEESIHEFVATQRKLLELELKAEEDEEKEIASSLRSGSSVAANKNDVEERPSHVLRKLEALETSVGLYGRTMVTLTRIDGNGETLLPAHRFAVGDEVEIQQQASTKNRVGGVISTITDTSITIALFGSKKTANDDEENSFLSSPPLAVIPKSSVEVHRKLVRSLAELERDGADHPVAGNIVKALFGPVESFSSPSTATSIEPFNANLDSSQLEAIAFCLSASNRPVSLIHGPPGTGKSTTIAELVQQAVFVHDMKVLVTAPSNVAVDNVLERLMVSSNTPQSTKHSRSAKKRNKKNNTRKLKTVRLGHPARIKESILPYSLESLVQNAEGTEIVDNVRSELQGFLQVLSNPKSRGSDKRVAYKEIKALRKEVRTREEGVVKHLLQQAQVVLATNVGAANSILNNIEFDLVVIDEAAQALEASCWIPILRGKRLVLAGDHCQLPPTIKSNLGEVQEQLGKTLFERTMERYGGNGTGEKGMVSRMLQVQYRMHSDIANWASTAMYHGQLETHDSVKDRTLSQLTHVKCEVGDGLNDIGDTRLLLIDTAGCEMNETVNAAGSRYNNSEAQIVAQHVQSLLSLGLKQEEIAVISPYNGQVELLRTLLLPDFPRLEIRSVDGFQGGEREAVVLSLVRSSDRGGSAGIGFLKDDRRLNVAVTRAKRHCALVCDSETVSQSDFVKNLVNWIEQHGTTRSAVEYLSSSQEGHLERDIQCAELELTRMVNATTMSSKRDGSSSAASEPNRAGISNSSKPSRLDSSQERQEGKEAENERRKALLDKITAFAENGEAGEEMRLSPDLSRFDRRVVHEFATQLGLDHRSEGVDGVDRRIILSIKKKVQASAPLQTNNVNAEEEKEEEAGRDLTERTSAFGALDIESEDDSSSESENARTKEDTKGEPRQNHEPTPMNSVLGDLAKERQRRQEQAEQNDGQSKTVKSAGKKKGKKKNNVQKLGSSKQKTSKTDTFVDDGLDDLDDMAFLDAQIEKVQTSHGRKVEGKGSYRSIVNGILISKPAPREPVKNQRASSALQSKLKQSQDDRKSKKTTKKKR